MIYKNLTTREFYASMPHLHLIAEIMKNGFKYDSPQWAISAMEELLRRDAPEKVLAEIDYALHRERLQLGTPMATLLGSDLTENKHRDQRLYKCGQKLLIEFNTDEIPQPHSVQELLDL